MDSLEVLDLKDLNEGIVDVTKQIHEWFIENKKTLSIAESCTGGGVASALVEIPGCSDYFMGGVVSYSNKAKTDVLGVRSETLESVGAVSSKTAVEMAQGVQRLMHTDYAVATTGITGPGGGSNEKPVGTVWLAVATPDKVSTMQLDKVDCGRHCNCRHAILGALTFLMSVIAIEERDGD